MPRGRGRGRGRSRSRLTRMDAAVDAMLPFGFREDKVKEHVKELLEVYGGDEGWPFIEESAYKVLIDTMLEESEDEDFAEQNIKPMEEMTSVGKEEGHPVKLQSDNKESSEAAATEPPRQRCLPCYGWIKSEEGENDDAFINLRAASTSTEARANSDVSRGRKKRKSR